MIENEISFYLIKRRGYELEINRILRYIQKKQPGTDRMESAEFGSAFPAEGVSQCEAAAEGAKKYPADMLIDEVIEEVFS